MEAGRDGIGGVEAGRARSGAGATLGGGGGGMKHRISPDPMQRSARTEVGRRGGERKVRHHGCGSWQSARCGEARADGGVVAEKVGRR